MGVRGLSKFISADPQYYMKPFKLSDTYLIVDGFNISCNLYLSLSKRDSVFGGDYDEFFHVAQKFFLALRKCKVTPIVFFDGAHELRKFKTVLSRQNSKLIYLELFARGHSPKKFFPLFLLVVFVEVIEKLKIPFVITDFEADSEIASAAKALNCPVLSDDTDFFIYGVLCIPFSHLSLDPNRGGESPSERDHRYLSCLAFDTATFLSRFEGMEKSVLPIMVALLGNDYFDPIVFRGFFNHITLPGRARKSFGQRKVQGVLEWLKSENFNSAVEGILRHSRKKDASKVLHMIRSIEENYRKTAFSSYVHQQIRYLLNVENQDFLSIKCKDFKIGWPPVIDSLYRKGKISRFVVDMIMFSTYFSPIQVEDWTGRSTHLSSFNLIKAILAIVRQYRRNKSNFLKVYVLHNKKYSAFELSDDFALESTDLNLDNILNKSNSERLELLFRILEFDEDDIQTVFNFTDCWYLFIMVSIYWIKSLKNSIGFSHINALLLMAVANGIVQKKVGYYETCSMFNKKNKKFLNEFKDLVIKETNNNVKEFKGMLSNVTAHECWLIQQSLIPLRHTTEEGRGQAYSISTIHLFNCFQSCLFHIREINALLNYPIVPHLKISDFISGTLFFNFYLNFEKARRRRGDFGEKFLKSAPNIGRIYSHLRDSFNKYLDNELLSSRKRSKRKRKKKNSSIQLCEFEVSFNNESVSE